MINYIDGKLNLKIDLSDGVAARWNGKFKSLQAWFDRAVLDACEEFTPKKTGALIQSGFSGSKIGSGRIVYTVPYAVTRYYGAKRGAKAEPSLRGPYWFERMKELRSAELAQQLILRAREAGGSADDY